MQLILVMTAGARRPTVLQHKWFAVRARNKQVNTNDFVVAPRKNPRQRKRTYRTPFERTRISRVAFTALFSAACHSCVFRAQAVCSGQQTLGLHYRVHNSDNP